jgi:hypothetical protein
MADKLDKSNPIVKYDRRFCEFKQINLLSKIDQDLFFSVLSIIRERRQTTVTITGKELIDRSGYLKRRLKQFSAANMIKLIDQMTDRINNCHIFMHDDVRNVDRKIFLFQSFELNRDSADFTASLTPVFANFFFDIKKFPFTRFALPGFIALKSKYSKALYRLFLDHYSGMEISANELFDLVGTLTATSQRQFIYKLPIYLNEIVDKTNDFAGPIYYDVIKEHERGRGSKYKSVVFKYKERKNRIVESNVVTDASLPCCPYCGQELTWRKNGQTGKTFIGHRDFVHSTCKIKGYNDMDDLQKHIAAVDDDHNAKTAAIAAAQHDPIYQAMFSKSKSDLPADFDPDQLFFGNNSSK